MRHDRCAFLVLILMVVGSVSLFAGQTKYLVYFKDKGSILSDGRVLTKGTVDYLLASSVLTPRALARRAKSLGSENLVTSDDLPVYPPYLSALRQTGAVVHHELRWENAASVYLDPALVPQILQLPFVDHVREVRRATVKTESVQVAEPVSTFAKLGSLSYGPSVTQNQAVNAIEMHNYGISGRGVLVGMLDTGFRWRVHESLNTRSVVAEHDFIFNDDTTANQAGDVSIQDQHGTLCMSTLGGFMNGRLIGPAYNADFILGKTEDVRSETKIEEDNWAAALEWMEGQGVDVVSSSLGYNDFDPLGPSVGDYTWANGDFDGQTTITARAAIHAARLGVLVCNAMGNEGNGDGIVGTLISPADADSILAVGAMTFSRTIASFSSTGPTNDDRIKPDIVAPGVGVYCASTSGADRYFYVQGTSLATPLTAASAALVLSVRPEQNAMTVRAALKSAADSIGPPHPNNFTGWGHVNALKAALSFGPIFSNEPVVTVDGGASVVSTYVIGDKGINPSSVLLYYCVGSEAGPFTQISMALDSSTIFPTSGRYAIPLPAQPTGTKVYFYIVAEDSQSRGYRSPAAITNTNWVFDYGVTGVGTSPPLPTNIELAQNYPNPFNPRTVIAYTLPRRALVRLSVYDVLGREVAELVNEVQDAGTRRISFSGDALASGVYVYVLRTPDAVAVQKMVLLR